MFYSLFILWSKCDPILKLVIKFFLFIFIVESVLIFNGEYSITDLNPFVKTNAEVKYDNETNNIDQLSLPVDKKTETKKALLSKKTIFGVTVVIVSAVVSTVLLIAAFYSR